MRVIVTSYSPPVPFTVIFTMGDTMTGESPGGRSDTGSIITSELGSTLISTTTTKVPSSDTPATVCDVFVDSSTVVFDMQNGSQLYKVSLTILDVVDVDDGVVVDVFVGDVVDDVDDVDNGFVDECVPIDPV